MKRDELLEIAKPIIFSTPMVQEILSGRKTQTRRIVKNKDIINGWDCEADGTPIAFIDQATGDSYLPTAPAPHKAGDILYVRETWRIGAWDECRGAIAVDYKADGCARQEWITIDDEERFNRYWVESTDDAGNAGLKLNEHGEYHWEPGKAPTRWRPSIFMPKEAARIFLRVIGVRLERLKDMPLLDVWSEGTPQMPGNTDKDGAVGHEDFRYLWDSINAKRGYGWEKNPWVWVYEFVKE